MVVAVGTVTVLLGLLLDIKQMFVDETGRALIGWVAILLAVGSVFYTLVEGWTPIDSFYFSVVTLTTVGFGDFSPVTTAGKLFTVAYILFGLSLIAVFARSLAEAHIQRVKEKPNTRRRGRGSRE